MPGHGEGTDSRIGPAYSLTYRMQNASADPAGEAGVTGLHNILLRAEGEGFEPPRQGWLPT